MESSNSLDPLRVSYKQALVRDPGNKSRHPPPPSGEDQKVDFNTPSSVNHYPDSGSMGDGDDDDIHDLLASILQDMTQFYHVYLIGKILGEFIPIKFIIVMCTFEWTLMAKSILWIKVMVSPLLCPLMKSIVREFFKANRGLLGSGI